MLYQMSRKRKLEFLDFAIKYYSNLKIGNFWVANNAICIILCTIFLSLTKEQFREVDGQYFQMTKIKFPELHKEIRTVMAQNPSGVFLRWFNENYAVQGRLKLVKRVKKQMLK